MLFKYLIPVSVLFSFTLVANEVKHTATAIKIDGIPEKTWDKATWLPMNHVMADSLPAPKDFSGRFKLLWDEEYVYLQAEIIDDILFDKTPDPREKYWEDDCLEIFIDSDGSGGDHQYNHTAFAYHIALDNNAVDLGADKKARLYNHHVKSVWQRDEQQPQKIIWEVAMKLFPNQYTDKQPLPALELTSGHKMGFMLAYCDNDGSQYREHFMGSTKIEPVNGDTNRGWIDANVFEKMTLIK